MTRSRRHRILYTIPNFDTAGSGKALMNIATRLDSGEFEPCIAALHGRGALAETVRESGIPFHTFPFVAPSRPVHKMLGSAWAVSRQFKEIKPDLIHSFHYSSDYTEAIAARLAGIPWVFTKKNMGWKGASYRSWRLRTRLSSGIVAQNTDMLEQFFKGSRKAALISRGVDTVKFEPKPPRPEIRNQMETGPDQRIVICVANMVPVKGVEYLIEAFSKAGKNHPDWVLWLVGDIDNDYGGKLIEAAKQSGMNDRIHFSGKQAEVGGFLDHAELFVLPTKDEGRREGSPVALLEAMANGKTVIASAVPGVRDQLADFPEFLFTPSDAEMLVDKLILRFRKSPTDNQSTGNRFRDHVRQNYRIEQEVTRHMDFYRHILN